MFNNVRMKAKMTDHAKRLIEKLHNENIDWCLQEKSQDSLRIIRDNIFDEKTHFILELIQNADDCCSEEVTFKIYPDRLVIENTGTSFDEKNVFALSNIGRSTKGENHIGFFGIGFKSVFQVTDSPEIHSGPYHFKYDDKNLIVPEWINQPDYEPLSGSVFNLPFKDNEVFKEINEQLNLFTGSVLLFLRHIKIIHVNDVSFELKKHSYVENTFTLLKNGSIESHLKKYSSVLEIPIEIQQIIQRDRGLKWSKKRLEEISISFQVDENGVPTPNQKGRIFAFFPTEITTGLSFNLQADFHVPLTRTTLQNPKGDWNQWIFQNAYQPIVKLIEDFKKSPILKTAFYSLFPKQTDLNHDYLESLKKGIDAYIWENPVVYTMQGKWVKPSQAIIPEEGISVLIEEKHLKRFYGKDNFYVSDEIDKIGISYLKEHIKEITLEALFDKVFPDNQWMENRPQIWFIKLYALVWDWIQTKSNSRWEKEQLINRIKKAKIFLSVSGKLKAVENKPRNLYRVGPQQIRFVSLIGKEYELLNQKLYTRIFSDATKSLDKKTDRLKARQLIEEIILILSAQQIIIDIIKPAFDNWKKHTDSKLLKYTDFIRRFTEKPEKDMILLREQKTKQYLKPSLLFLPPEYSVDSTLRDLFQGFEASFVSTAYIKEQTLRDSEKSREQITSWRNFFRKLGVNERPVIVTESNDIEKKDIEIILSKYYPNRIINDSNWGYQKKDHNFDKSLRTVIDSLKDKDLPNRLEKAKLLLRVLNDNWDYYKNFLKCYYQYHPTGAYGWSKDELGPSSLATTIKETPWIPTLKGHLLKPAHVFLNNQTIREAMGDQVEYIDGVIDNVSLIQFAEINDKPSALSALNHLRSLIEQKSSNYDSFRRCYMYFRDYLADHNSLAEDKEAILKAFHSEQIIFVPEHKINPYRNYKEVVWLGPSFINEYKPDLDRYFDLKDFFVNSIGIIAEPTTEDYINYVIYLSQKEELNFLQQDALLSSYRKMDSALTDEDKTLKDGKHKGQQKNEMWGILRQKARLWCQNKVWSSFQEQLFYNDDEHLNILFKDRLSIIYLDTRNRSKLPIRFLAEFGIRGLKEAVQEIAPHIEEEVLREGSTEERERIKNLIPYIFGFVKKHDPEKLEMIEEDDAFNRFFLSTLRIVSRIQSFYKIDQICILNPEDKSAFYDDTSNALYMRGSLGECVDDVGMIIDEIVGGFPGLVDFLSRIMSLDEVDRQQIIRKRKIEWVEATNKPDPAIAKEKNKENMKSAVLEEGKKPTKARQEDITKITPPKPTFNIDEYIFELNQITSPISITHVDENSLQVIFGGQVTESWRGRGGGLWSGLTDEEKKQIGNAAERIVYLNEKTRLKSLFESDKISKDLSEKVDYIAERDDNAGYDIQSWDDEGSNTYIEVKGTSSAESMEFPMSREEFKMAEEKGDKYVIYRVLNIGKGKIPSIIKIKNPFKLWRNNKLRLVSKQLLVTVKLIE